MDNKCPRCGAKRTYVGYGGKAKRWICGSHGHEGIGFFVGRTCYLRQVNQLTTKVRQLERENEELGDRLHNIRVMGGWDD